MNQPATRAVLWSAWLGRVELKYSMQNEITKFRCGGSTANAEQPGKRRDITRWRESRRRRLACIKQPTEMQLARSEMLDRQLDAERPNEKDVERRGL